MSKEIEAGCWIVSLLAAGAILSGELQLFNTVQS